MPTPVEAARADIDRQLQECGLVILGYRAAESQLAPPMPEEDGRAVDLDALGHQDRLQFVGVLVRPCAPPPRPVRCRQVWRIDLGRLPDRDRAPV